MTLNSKTKTELDFLSALEEGEVVTQMTLAKRIGVAVGLINALLRRSIHKGYVKAKAAPYKRYAYYLTPKGFSEKTRLVTEYLETSLEFFRTARQQYAELFERAHSLGMRRIALIGSGELAEIGLMAARDAEIEIVAILDSNAVKGRLYGLKAMQNPAELPPVDGVVISESRIPQAAFDLVRRYFADHQVLAPPILRIVREPLEFKPRLQRT